MPVLINTSGLEKNYKQVLILKRKKSYPWIRFCSRQWIQRSLYIQNIYKFFRRQSILLYFKLLLFSSKQTLSKTSRKSFFYVKGLLPSYPTREYIPIVQKIGHFSWLSKPSVHLRVVMVFIFSDFFFLQTQPQGFLPSSSSYPWVPT